VKSFILAASLMVCPLAAAAAPDAAQVAAMCGTRSTCTVGNSYDGGKSPNGSPLTVVEVHFAVQDKPDNSPDDGCRTEGDKRDGGVEYWLLDGPAAPKRLLSLCNDGYGAAGIGEDEVTIGPNRLVHEQSGGSAWRYHSTFTFTLSPSRMASERDCSFHDASEVTGTTTDIDYQDMTARSIAKDSTNKDNGIGCPEWPADASRSFSPAPAPGAFAAYDIVAPFLGAEPDQIKIPSGTAIGDCVAAMSTSGAHGFMVFGSPAAAAEAAEVRVVAESIGSLLIQVLDPLAGEQSAPAGGSWINLPHLEMWIGHNDMNVFTRLPLAELNQIGIDLDGRVYQGVGKKAPLPTVERWQAKDGSGRAVVVMRVRWADEFALLHGAAIVYSQAQAGKQTRLVATTGIVNNRPLYVPEIVSLGMNDIDPRPGRCRIDQGRLSKSE
jgi:hypothetical protein